MNQKPDKLIPAVYGGAIMALISAIPFINFVNCLCCAGVMLGGFLAVFFYKNNFPPDSTLTYTSGDCMGVGALAGVFGAVFGTILSFAVMALFGNFWIEYLLEMMRSFNVDIPSEAMEAMEQSMSAGISAFSIIFQLIANLIIDTLFGLVGGLIGYSVYKPKKSAMPPPMPQPPVI